MKVQMFIDCLPPSGVISIPKVAINREFAFVLLLCLCTLSFYYEIFRVYIVQVFLLT